MAVCVRPVESFDSAWIEALMAERWGAPLVASRGRLHRPSQLPGFVAEVDGERRGLLTYRFDGGTCEIVTLDSLEEEIGVATRLLEATREAAGCAGCSRIWLVTTNDNLHALGFYQRRGFRLAALHRDALEVSRRLKPEIPQVGHAGIPIRDEIELEIVL